MMNLDEWVKYYQENPDQLRAFITTANKEANRMADELNRRKDNSQCRYLAYAKVINGAWWAKVFDTQTETVCYEIQMNELDSDFSNTEDDALDVACGQANLLEEQADRKAQEAQNERS